MEVEIRLTTASYSKEDDGVVVELYGKTGEGKSVVGRYHGFKPYFYLAIYNKEMARRKIYLFR